MIKLDKNCSNHSNFVAGILWLNFERQKQFVGQKKPSPGISRGMILHGAFGRQRLRRQGLGGLSLSQHGAGWSMKTSPAALGPRPSLICATWKFGHFWFLKGCCVYIYIYELRSKLCSWPIGHVQTGWSPIGCEGFEFLEFSLSEVIKVSEAVPL